MSKRKMSKEKDGIFYDLFNYKKQKFKCLAACILSFVLLKHANGLFTSIHENDINDESLASTEDVNVSTDKTTIAKNADIEYNYENNTINKVEVEKKTINRRGPLEKIKNIENEIFEEEIENIDDAAFEEEIEDIDDEVLEEEIETMDNAALNVESEPIDSEVFDVESEPINSEVLDVVQEPIDEVNFDAEKKPINIENVRNLMVKERLNSLQLMTLLNYMVEGNSPFSFGCNNIQDALELLLNNEYSCELTMLIVMARDDYTYNQLDTVCAGVCAEAAGAGTNETDAWGVSSVLVNRTRDAAYVRSHTASLYEQFIAPGQFSVYKSGSYKKYRGRIDLPGYQTAIETFYTRESMHDWKEFRGWWVDVNKYEHEQYVHHGNQYMIRMKPEKTIADPEFILEEDEVQNFVLSFLEQGFVIEDEAVMKRVLTP